MFIYLIYDTRTVLTLYVLSKETLVDLLFPLTFLVQDLLCPHKYNLQTILYLQNKVVMKISWGSYGNLRYNLRRLQ